MVETNLFFCRNEVVKKLALYWFTLSPLTLNLSWEHKPDSDSLKESQKLPWNDLLIDHLKPKEYLDPVGVS